MASKEKTEAKTELDNLAHDVSTRTEGYKERLREFMASSDPDTIKKLAKSVAEASKEKKKEDVPSGVAEALSPSTAISEMRRTFGDDKSVAREILRLYSSGRISKDKVKQLSKELASK